MLHAPLVQLLDAGLEWKWCCLRRRLNFMSDVFVSSCDLFSSAWQHQPHQTATPPVFRLEAPPQTPETQQTLPGAQHIDLANLQISAQRPTAAASAPAAQPTEPRPATKDGVPLTHKTAANTYLVPMPAHYACVVGAMRDWAAPASEGTRQATADGSSDEALQQLLNDVRVPLECVGAQPYRTASGAAEQLPCCPQATSQGATCNPHRYKNKTDLWSLQEHVEPICRSWALPPLTPVNL